HTPIFNRTFLAFAMLAGAFALGTWFYRQNKEIDQEERTLAIAVMIGAANLLAIIGLSLEVRGYFKAKQDVADSEWRMLEESKQFLLTALWTVYGTVALAIGLKRRARMIRNGALGLLLLAVFKVFAIDLFFAATPGHILVFNKTFGAFIILVAALGFSLWLFSRSDGVDPREREIIRNWLTIALNLLAIIGLSAEAYGFFEARIGDAPSAENRDLLLAQKLSLSIVWAIYGLAMLLYGIWNENRLLRRMALGLLSLTIAKVFIIDSAGLDSIYRIAAFFILGTILLVVAFKYQQRQRREAEERR
ncbi:MAG: DUF2339 domain-containing protein, partial [Acidobacteria bacterium]|nr:DUF2339 domain-containing protein [Acidobacteriota bacterium]